MINLRGKGKMKIGTEKFKALVRSKSFWTGISAIAASIAGFVSKQADLPTTVGGVIGGMAIISLRQAIEKSGPNGGA